MKILDEKKTLSMAPACHSVNHLFFKSLGPLLPFIIPTFNLIYTQAGRLGLTYYIVYGISNSPSGHWADRYGRKRMIFLFLFISSMATLLMAVFTYIMDKISDRTSLGASMLFLSIVSFIAGFISMINPQGGDV